MHYSRGRNIILNPLVKEIPFNPEFEYGRVDWVIICSEVITILFQNVIQVFVFSEDIGAFDAQAEEHVKFRVVSCFCHSLIVELHDRRLVIVGIEFGVVEKIESHLYLQGFLEQIVFIVVV